MFHACTRAAIAALCLIGAAAPASADTPPPGLPAAVQEAMQTYPSAGIAIARIEDGALAWTYYAGEQAPGVPATRETRFNTGSITKTITAELILRLAGAGHLSLDEPIANAYVHPDLAEDPRYRELTPRVILSHQSGLKNWAYEYPDFRLAFIQDPGAGYTYSGEAFDMLAAFAAARMDTPFPALVDAYVFTPMGLGSMALGATAAEGPFRAQPMNAQGVYGEPDRFAYPPSSADNLFTTLEDYAAFLTAVLADERRRADRSMARREILVSTEGLAPCLIEPATLCPQAAGFGLGWEVFAYEDGVLLHHGGSDWGENALAYIETASGDGYVMLVNGGAGRGVILSVLEALDPEDPLARYFLALPVVQEWLAGLRAEG